MEVIHTTDSPLKQVSLGERMAGLWDDYHGRDEMVSTPSPDPESSFTLADFLPPILVYRFFISKERRINTESL